MAKLWTLPDSITESEHQKKKKKLRGFRPQVNYTNQATAACRVS
jgi:hypothetical protein